MKLRYLFLLALGTCLPGTSFAEHDTGDTVRYGGNIAVAPGKNITVGDGTSRLFVSKIEPTYDAEATMFGGHVVVQGGHHLTVDSQATFNDAVVFNKPVTFNDVTTLSSFGFSNPTILAGGKLHIGSGPIDGISNAGRAVLRINFLGSGDKNALVRLTVSGKYQQLSLTGYKYTEGIYRGELLVSNENNGGGTKLFEYNKANDGSAKKLAYKKVTTSGNTANVFLEDTGLGVFIGGLLVYEVIGDVSSVQIFKS